MKFIFCCLLFFTIAYAEFGGEFYINTIKGFGRIISNTRRCSSCDGLDFLMTMMIAILFAVIFSMCFYELNYIKEEIIPLALCLVVMILGFGTFNYYATGHFYYI